jgi:hypothetical protein
MHKEIDGRMQRTNENAMSGRGMVADDVMNLENPSKYGSIFLDP